MREAEVHFTKIKKNYLKFLSKQKILSESFYDKLGQLRNFYLPICDFVYKNQIKNKKPTVIGLSGGQGAGKTTISGILKIILKIKFNLSVVVFSIDDFYKTFIERKRMSKNIHKLFLIRGVPGTHDVKLLKNFFTDIHKKKFKTLYIPKFDKSKDDRFKKKKWTKLHKRPDIIIFEGWCLGAKPQSAKKLRNPINTLEKKHDKRLIWRKKVNNELKNMYKMIFKSINKLIFLQVPSFKHVYKWRLLQEKKLNLASRGRKIMTNLQIKNFIMHYERTTLQMIKDLSSTSDILVKIDKKHRLSSIKFK